MTGGDAEPFDGRRGRTVKFMFSEEGTRESLTSSCVSLAIFSAWISCTFITLLEPTVKLEMMSTRVEWKTHCPCSRTVSTCSTSLRAC